METCDRTPEACVADHLCPILDGRPGTDGQWSAICPAHDDQKRSLAIRTGTRGQRIIWHCKAGCDGVKIRKALLAKGIFGRCIPWSGVAPGKPAEVPKACTHCVGVELQFARLEELIGVPMSGSEFRIRAGQLLWGCDAMEAAERLGLSQATAYRYRNPK